MGDSNVGFGSDNKVCSQGQCFRDIDVFMWVFRDIVIYVSFNYTNYRDINVQLFCFLFQIRLDIYGYIYLDRYIDKVYFWIYLIYQIYRWFYF